VPDLPPGARPCKPSGQAGHAKGGSVTAIVLRGDAAHLPLPDNSCDLIVTSPPYFALRDYRDGGEPLAGQIGSEGTPQEYLKALWRCTAEWVRVLKPEGSIFVVLGDKYCGYTNGQGKGRNLGGGERSIAMVPDGPVSAPSVYGVPNKSLMLLPERYRIGCVDRLGLIAREVIEWSKVNGMPESASDRCRRSHEDIIHLVKQPRYFDTVDEIREPHQPQSLARTRRNRFAPDLTQVGVGSPNTLDPAGACHPLGRLPGSVWEIATAPLIVPDRIAHAHCCGGRKREDCEDGLTHHAAYPPELCRRLILGWSPSGICLECSEGRRPVSTVERTPRPTSGPLRGGRNQTPRDGHPGVAENFMRLTTITGYACACTPYTDHPGSGKPTRRRDYNPGPEGYNAQGTYGQKQAGEYERVGPWREYHLDRWTPPPTRPAVVVDVFGGTGTTSLVADVLGRIGITVDRSADYCRLARWRTSDPAERARALGVPKPPPVPEGQRSLFDAEEAS
jgi:DNA modification methylase